MIFGLIDVYMYIESFMMIFIIFFKVVVCYGVIMVIVDVYEMVNVFGLEGLKVFMVVEIELDIFYVIFFLVFLIIFELEIIGGIIGLVEVVELFKELKVICLGEVMNFKGIFYELDFLIC